MDEPAIFRGALVFPRGIYQSLLHISSPRRFKQMGVFVVREPRKNYCIIIKQTKQR